MLLGGYFGVLSQYNKACFVHIYTVVLPQSFHMQLSGTHHIRHFVSCQKHDLFNSVHTAVVLLPDYITFSAAPYSVN